MDKSKTDEMDLETGIALIHTRYGKKKLERHRRYRSFEAKKPRERNTCPKCGSLDVKKRRSTLDYKCGRCGWIGESVGKIEW